MIERYTDHAANERTFLAWVRTSIAIMAFGFLVEKFDLFLEFASKPLAARMPSVGGQPVGNIAGLLLIALGGATMVLAVIRFRQTGLNIDSAETRPGTHKPNLMAMLSFGPRLPFSVTGGRTEKGSQLGGPFHFKPSVQCRLLALSGHSNCTRVCPLGEKKQTWQRHAELFRFDP